MNVKNPVSEFVVASVVALVVFVPTIVSSDQPSTSQVTTTQRGSSALTIKVVGARNAKGTLAVALWKDAAAFPEDSTKAIRQRNIDLDARTLSAQTVFDDLPPGVYAVAVYHDENSNGNLDRGMFGRPTEGYGASNDARSMFSAPSFDEAQFALKAAAHTIEIKLGY